MRNDLPARDESPEDDSLTGSGATEPEVPTPSISEFLERHPLRLLVEASLGAVTGAILGELLRPEQPSPVLFAAAGAVLAPLSLMLTPLEGGIPYRAVRYGAALAILGTLLASFAADAGGVRVDELIALGVVLFGVGALGHGAMAAASPWT